MNFFPDERAAELRELFFESAQELLQELNEAGLELEARPDDAEIVRRVRRVVHTLKGDSAACGFQELSSLAHEMEDALAPQAVRGAKNSLVEVIFTAADTFQAMLAAYRKSLPPPTGDALREHIRQIASTPAKRPAAPAPAEAFSPKFDWNASQRDRISNALGHGECVFNIALQIDPSSGMRSAAFQLIRNVLEGVGSILAIHPSDVDSAEFAAHVEAALATEHSKSALAKKCRIPSVVADITVHQVSEAQEPSQDLLDVLLQAEAHASGAAVPLHKARAPQARPVPAPESEESRREARASATLAAAQNTLRVDATRIDTVLNLIGELIIGKSMLHRTIIEFDKHHAKDPLRSRFADALAFQSRVLEDLQRSVMKIRMVPVEQLFRRFPRIVRDVSLNCGRDVALEIAGEHTDLDKGILDALAEPIAHLVRNAVDHGIETPEEREAKGKPKSGVIRLNAYHQGNQVVIEVSDDGRGIDRKKLVSRAVERGSISAAEASKFTEEDATRLIFQPGLSTADAVTEVSGRGVGMDAVIGVLERLKGTIETDSIPGQGTTFRIFVPLTLASIQALLFKVTGHLYAVPLANVVEITRVAGSEIHRVDDYEVIRLRDQLLTLVHLDRLTAQNAKVASSKSFVIIIGAGEKKFGLIVDSLMGEEELVIKALDDRLSSSDFVSGASILGDGTVVLILNIPVVASRLARLPALGAIA
ncbi:MAG TPA: chemotaxis protein CheA [Candidatus Acidoferrales bacterium]|nr:chemotaxis protein CheA [Candidatus Acidoferrales bacterium]